MRWKAANTRAFRPALRQRLGDRSRASVRTENGAKSYSKGGFEVLLARSECAPTEIQQLAAENERESGRGRRVIAVGCAAGESEDNVVRFWDWIAIWDPPREEGGKGDCARSRRGGARADGQGRSSDHGASHRRAGRFVIAGGLCRATRCATSHRNAAASSWLVRTDRARHGRRQAVHRGTHCSGEGRWWP